VATTSFVRPALDRGRFLLSALLLVFALAAPAAATPPAIDEIYVDIDGVSRIAADFFTADVVDEARREMVRQMQKSGWLRAPFGEAFVSLGQPFRLRDGLRMFWSQSCGKGACDLLRRFFTEVSARTRVRGMLSSPSYSGCAEVVLDLAPGGMVSLELRARQFTGCPIATRGKRVGGYSLPMTR